MSSSATTTAAAAAAAARELQIPPHASEEQQQQQTNDRDMIRVPTRFGACVDRITGVERCALAPSSCEPREDYVGSHITSKICQYDDVFLGRCAGGQQRCAPSQDACGGSGGIDGKNNEFLHFPTGGHCTLVTDTIDSGGGTESALQATVFPSCHEDHHRCVIDSAYCRPGETIQSPQASVNHDSHQCYCQDVKVGLCYEKGLKTNQITVDNSYCAVTRKDCPLHSHQYLDGLHLSLFNCRLCDVSNKQMMGEDLVGACVDEEMVGSQKQVHAVCVTTAQECIHLGRSRYYTPEELLSLHGMYCPASRVSGAAAAAAATAAPVTMRPTNKPTTQEVIRTTAPVLPADTITLPTVTTINNPVDEETIFVPSAEDEQQLSTAAIYWIVIASLFALVSLVSIVGSYCWYQRKRKASVQKTATFMNLNHDSFASVDAENLPEID